MFLQQTVNSGGLPFQPANTRPYAETLQAMRELESGGGQVFQTTAELFSEPNHGDELQLVRTGRPTRSCSGGGTVA